MSFGQHALMQDAGNQNTSALLPIEQDMLAMLMAAQARTNFVAESAQRWIVGKRLAASLQLAKVTGGLDLASFAKSIVGDGQQVGFSATRKSKLTHRGSRES